MELMELKNSIKQASQEAGINNGLLLSIVTFVWNYLLIKEESQMKHQVVGLLEKCKSYQIELKELQNK